MLSISIEDYIKTIHALEMEEERATTKRIAQRLDVKMASVTGMVKHLAAEGYVRHIPYRGVKLTEKGRRIAVDLIRRHRLIELFLHETLSVTWDEVDADADLLEHAVSDHLIERIYEFLGCPAFDPHGAPIPLKDGAMPPRQGVLLSELGDGERGRIVEVSDRDPEFLRYMTKLRLCIGSEVCIRERAPFHGPISIEVGSKAIAIGLEAAKRIRVESVACADQPPKQRPKGRKISRKSPSRG